MFIPLAPFDSDAAADLPAGAWQPRTRLALLSGEAIEHRVFWITAEPRAREPGDWLAPALRWRAIDAAEAGANELGVLPAQGIGFWAMVIPWDSRLPDRLLYLGPVRVPVIWLDEAQPAAADPAAVDRTLLEALAADPAESWRAALALGAPALAGANPSLPEPLALLSRTVQRRWLHAIESLRAHDEALSRRLRHAFTVAVRAPDGGALPAWRQNDPGAATLLDALLDPLRDGDDRAGRVRDYLAQQPGALAWVIDDAAAEDGAPRARLGIANLAPDDMPLTVSAGAGQPVQPVVATAGALDEALVPTGGANTVTIIAPDRTAELVLNGAAVRVSAPGLRTGPFLQQWTLASWRRGTPEPAPEARRTAAQLYQREGGRWELFIECADSAHDSGTSDTVRVHLGPRDTPVGMIILSAGGDATDNADGALISAADPVVLPPARPGEPWSARLTVPAFAIEPPGVLHLALERIDGAGWRSSWPRAAMPGQQLPGRVRLDLSAWDPAALGR